MALNWGAVNFGATEPAGYLQESSKETSRETATIRSAEGYVAHAIAKPRKMTTITLKTKGEFSLFTVAMGDHGSSQFINSAKVSETNDDFAVSEVTYLQFETVV
jgi:hypothetical protein